MASKIDNRDGHRDYIMVKRQIEIFLLAMFLFWLFLSVGGFLLSEISQKTSCMGGMVVYFARIDIVSHFWHRFSDYHNSGMHECKIAMQNNWRGGVLGIVASFLPQRIVVHETGAGPRRTPMLLYKGTS
jgi:hypothetical protein